MTNQTGLVLVCVPLGPEICPTNLICISIRKIKQAFLDFVRSTGIERIRKIQIGSALNFENASWPCLCGFDTARTIFTSQHKLRFLGLVWAIAVWIALTEAMRSPPPLVVGSPASEGGGFSRVGGPRFNVDVDPGGVAEAK